MKSKTVETSAQTSRRDRSVDTLERLLAIEPLSLQDAMAEAAQLVAESLEADKVDAFLYDAAIHSLVAVGTSDTPLGRKERSLGLDRLPIVNGGRSVQVYQSGTPFVTGHTDEDPEELQGLKCGLKVRSSVAVPLRIGGQMRGVLAAESTKPEFFAEGDVRFLESVSSWVGLVAHRAELVQRIADEATRQGRQMAAEELITILAHDLRNLLAPLKGRIDMIVRRGRRENRESDLQDAQEASNALARINKLISDLLDAARLEQGVFSIDVQMADLSSLIEGVARQMRSPGRDIQVEAPPELLVPLDANRMEQALENLVANAMQYAPHGTEVQVRAEPVEEDGRRWVRIVVIDQGPGIPSEAMPSLFDRYSRGNASVGLGIGLHLAKGIVEAHGGTISVDSVPGQTSFTVVLPA